MAKIIYEEEKVPDYTLPAPLKSIKGEKVENSKSWFELRRQEIKKLFTDHVYGQILPELEMEINLNSKDQALGANAVRKQVSVVFKGENAKNKKMDILIYLPGKAKKPVPLFLGLNFNGNLTIHSDPGIFITDSWLRNNEKLGIKDNRAHAKLRGIKSSSWPVEKILKRGYGLATIYCGDLSPDRKDGLDFGINQLFKKINKSESGTINNWAWGLSRALDYFGEDPDIAQDRVAVFGHSRLGKTALWAGAQDERFALVISNNSGCGGAAISRRKFGETIEKINTTFPHWFCQKFKEYNDSEENLPVDQHLLLALIAPRPLYVASAEDDLWADPRGEFISAREASLVYKLLGKNGLEIKRILAINQPIQTGDIGYHIRDGGHGLTEYDWEQYLDFADKYLLK